MLLLALYLYIVSEHACCGNTWGQAFIDISGDAITYFPISTFFLGIVKSFLVPTRQRTADSVKKRRSYGLLKPLYLGASRGR